MKVGIYLWMKAGTVTSRDLPVDEGRDLPVDEGGYGDL